jgi:gamma-glutamyltranspeptidase/glutathione hydrolase
VEGIVNPHMYTIGGECPMLLYSVDQGKVVCINGNTESPAGATLDAYRKRGLELVPPDGVLAAGAPAAFSALMEMLIRYGSLPLESIMGPAHLLARDGFPAHDGLIAMPRHSLNVNREKFLNRWPHSAKLYLSEDGDVPPVGWRMTNPATASLFDTLMETARRKGRAGRQDGLRAARDTFYRGDVADEIARYVAERDGYLTRDDLARYRTHVEEPASVHFRETTVFKCGPWSQGPVFLQLLRLLEGFPLEAMKHNSADYVHLWIEAAKLAYADREQYYADPGIVSVPLPELLSLRYNDERRKLIDMKEASGLHRPGDPRNGRPLLPPDEVFLYKSWGFGTVHVAVIDAKGNMAALTPSGGWISGNEVIPSLGFPLTSRLQTFYLEEGHPNVLAPRKRPRTTLSPSLAFHRGRPWMVFGTMGGDQQDQWTSQFFLNRVVFGMSVQEAIEAPKVTCEHIPGTFHPHEAFPGRLTLEARIPQHVAEDLRRRGHDVRTGPDWSAGYICAVARNEAGLLEAGADPRGRKGQVFPSCALAW